MTATSQIPIQPGSLKYGRSAFLIWDVVDTPEGYEYQYVEFPIGATESEIIEALTAEGVDPGRVQEIIPYAGSVAVR